MTKNKIVYLKKRFKISEDIKKESISLNENILNIFSYLLIEFHKIDIWAYFDLICM